MSLHRNLFLLVLAGAASATAVAADIGISIGGEIKPGVYGRIDIGNAAPPPVVYAQPVIAVPPARPLPGGPLYLNVPPGHAKNWGKHCARYDACGRPVYFVRTAEYDGEREHPGKGHGRGKHGRD